MLTFQRPGDASFLSPNHISVSANYFQLFKIKLLAGRALADNREEDNFYESQTGVDPVKNEGHNLMVNASLARALGYSPDDIIGKTFVVGKSHMRVVGVVADTLTEGVRQNALQTAYVHNVDNLQNVVIQIAPGRERECADAFAERGLSCAAVGRIDDGGTLALSLGGRTATVLRTTGSPVTRLAS